MITEIQKLEKTIKEQEKQIDSLRKAMSGMMQKMMMMDKKLNRTYQSSRKNTMDIMKVSSKLTKNG